MKQKRKTRRKRQNLTAICVTLAMIMTLFVGIPFTPITAHAAESKNIGTDVVYAAGDTIVLPDGGSYFKFDKYSNAEQKSGNSTVNITNSYGDNYDIETSGDWSSYFYLNGHNNEYASQGLVVIGIKFSGSGTSEDPYIPLLAYGELDAVWEGDGEGTESSPYLINNVNDLKTLADNVKSGMLYGGKYFKLTSDIDCGEENWEPIGGTNQFRGTFDGDGNTVTYHITDNNEDGSKGLGLFYGIAVSGTVKNLKVSGSIVGTSIYGNYYAGIAGFNRGTIINCSSNVNITSPGCYIAGIAGFNKGTISYCAASGSIMWNGDSNSYAYVAGMTGENDGTVTNCTSLCDISAVNANGYSYASRVIGRNFGTVQNCYYLSSATIIGDYVGTNDATEKTTDELKEIGVAAYNAGYNVYGLALGYMSAPTIKTQPEDIELTYGYTEGSVSVEATTEKGLTLSYQWYSNSTNTTEGGTAIIDADNASYVIPVGKDVGTEEYYYCVVTASSMNASITTTSDIAKVTVKKADASVEVVPEAKTLTYTGSAQELITAGTAKGGTMKYAITTVNQEPSADAYTFDNTSLPTGTDAGTYYVWYKVVGDENHSDTTPASVTVTIQRRSSGGGSSTTTVTVPVTSDAAPGTVPVKASVSGTTATVTKLTDEQLAQVTTNKSGNKDADAETETNSVVIDVSGVAKDVKTATIPTETVKAVEETGSNLKVTLTDGSVEFDATAQAIITDEAKGTTIQVNLDAVKVTTLTSAQQSAVESLEVEVVLDAYVTSNGQRISDFKGGSATLSVPYTLKDGQAAQGIVVWYVASDGTRTQVDASYDGKNVVFTVPHFSNYVIAYDAAKAAACPQDTTCPISAFTDARTTAWYHDGVHWAIENSVMNGVGDGKFAPNGITTRAQVVTMLWRLEGSPAYVGMSEFSDVDNEQWYGPAIRWASAEGIVNGYDDGRFGANDAVTREQLVTILYRYAQYKKMDVSVGEDTNILSYDDAFDVSEWAIPAMQWACGSGIVNGIDKNGTLMLAPSDASTRAVVATMFWRFSK